MKVLHVIPSLGPARGGPSVALPIMARTLAGLGVEVHIATTDDNGPDERLTIPLGVPIVQHEVATWYFPRQIVPYTFSWPLAHWLWKHVRDYDLLHLHALFSFAALPAALAARHSGVPYVVRPLGTLNRWGMQNRRPLLKQTSFRLIESRILTGAAAIQYTSEQERQEATTLGIRTPAAVIPLGLDLSEFDSLPSPDEFRRVHPELQGKTVVLFLSRIDEKKGLDLLLPAFASLLCDHPTLMLVVAGSGESDYIAHLQRTAQDLDLDGRVLWSGFLHGRDKLAAFACADLFVLPSYSENFGVAPVEAMACGTPVVVSDQIGVAATIARHGGGIVAPCTVDGLVAALSQMIASPECLPIMGREARRVVESQFSAKKAAHDLLDLYAGLCRPTGDS